MSRTRRLLAAWLIIGLILWLICWHKASGAEPCPPGRNYLSNHTYEPGCRLYCPPGQKCPSPQQGQFKIGLQATIRRKALPARRPMVPVIRTNSVVPVLFGVNDPSPGAGVYVGVIEGRGITLTCWHAAKYGVRSAGGAQATEVTRDKFGYDLAAVMTAPLDVRPITLGPPATVGAVVTIAGYPHGRYGQRQSRVVGFFEPGTGQEWRGLKLAGSSVDGDSGGAVLDVEHRLVGLLWGTATDGSRTSAAVSVAPIADFMRRIRIMLAERKKVWPDIVPGPSDGIDSVGNALGNPATQPPPARAEIPPAETEAEPPPADDVIDSLRDPLIGLRDRLDQQQAAAKTEDRLSQIEAAVTADSLRAIIGEAAGPVAPGILTAAVPAILAGLGWTGPPALAAIVGLKVFSALVQRRKRWPGKEVAPAASEFPGPESPASIPRDDTEAAEFLRLSQLEGRSPLHDALVGRIAFDELDKTIDSKPDGPAADWARKLRRQLEDRFNEMAPPAVYAGAGRTT